MADLLFDNGADLFGDGGWVTDTHKMMLLDNTYTPSATDHFVSDVVAKEITAAGYGRWTVTTPARNVNTGTSKTEYSCDQPSFGTMAAGQTARYVALFRFITNDAASPLIAVYDIGATDTADVNPVLGSGRIIALLSQI